MGCVCFKDCKNDPKTESQKFRTLEKYRLKHWRFLKKRPQQDLSENKGVSVTKNNNINIEGMELTNVTFPSVRINDITTPMEKLKKTFSGIYYRDIGLTGFVKDSYIDNNPDSSPSNSPIKMEEKTDKAIEEDTQVNTEDKD